MFAASLHLHRLDKDSWQKGIFLDGLCGESADVSPLEQGTPSRNQADGTLHYSLLNTERGMDRQVEERVAVEIAAVFLLTARTNHSCALKTEVRSQEFVDCTRDLVAIIDVEKGEEITISYILTRVGEQSRRKRQRELQAKYLFICDCERCKEDS